MNKNAIDEFGERVCAAIYEENSGNVYRRQHIVQERAMDAKFIAAEKKVDVCVFVNKYGWCKLDAGHQGSHTVINLGEDD
jgi:hypothetical protein